MSRSSARVPCLLFVALIGHADADSCTVGDERCASQGASLLMAKTEGAKQHVGVAFQNQVLASSPTLEFRHTERYEESYSDRGTGSYQDLSVWRPKLFPGEYRVYYTGTNSRSLNDRTVVVTKSSAGALSKPAYFVCKWTDQSSGGSRDGSLWQAVSQSGYTCLSDVAVYKSNSGNHPGRQRTPDEIDSRFRCVHNSLIKSAELGDRVWTDRGSGAKYDGAVWSIGDSDGMRVGNGAGDVPSYHQQRLAAFTGTLYRDLVLITAINNPSDIEQPHATYTMARGMSSTRSSSSTISTELAIEVSAKASAGVEGVASSELSTTITTKFGTSTTFGSSDTSTQTSEITVNFHVPAKTRAELYQLIVKDANSGPGSFTIKSGQYTLVYKAL